MDMDKIFNHEDVQLSKDEFRKTYVFVPEFATADEAKTTRCICMGWKR